MADKYIWKIGSPTSGSSSVGSGGITDVLVNGESVVSDGVASISVNDIPVVEVEATVMTLGSQSWLAADNVDLPTEGSFILKMNASSGKYKEITYALNSDGTKLVPTVTETEDSESNRIYSCLVTVSKKITAHWSPDPCSDEQYKYHSEDPHVRISAYNMAQTAISSEDGESVTFSDFKILNCIRVYDGAMDNAPDPFLKVDMDGLSGSDSTISLSGLYEMVPYLEKENSGFVMQLANDLTVGESCKFQFPFWASSEYWGDDYINLTRRDLTIINGSGNSTDGVQRRSWSAPVALPILNWSNSSDMDACVFINEGGHGSTHYQGSYYLIIGSETLFFAKGSVPSDGTGITGTRYKTFGAEITA